MRYSGFLAIFAILFFAPQLYAAEGGGGGGGGMPQAEPRRTLTPEEKAVVSYNRGLKHRDKAARFQEKAVDEDNERKYAKLQKKIAKEYEKAIDDYEKAVGHYQRFYQAHSSLGFALRNIHRYEESLAAYNESLRINPHYHEATEYRGEAYLGLNRIEEAKAAYMELFQNDRALADQLMAAMLAWVAMRRDDAGELDTAVVEQFATWVDERNTLASFVHPRSDSPRLRWATAS